MEFKVTTAAHQDTVRLEGHVNETAVPAFVLLERRLKSVRVAFNLRGVDSFNSLGAMEWMALVGRLARTREVVFEDCGPAFVDLANMIPQFAEPQRVVNVLAPYACRKCGERFAVPFQAAQAKALSRFPTHACAACGGEAAAEVPSEDYCLFLRA